MGNIRMYHPQVIISRNKAKVNTIAKYGKVYTKEHIFTLGKENDNWLIMRMERYLNKEVQNHGYQLALSFFILFVDSASVRPANFTLFFTGTIEKWIIT